MTANGNAMRDCDIYVTQVLNESADDVMGWFGAEETGTRDAVNLIVNVFCERIKGSNKSITDFGSSG